MVAFSVSKFRIFLDKLCFPPFKTPKVFLKKCNALCSKSIFARCGFALRGGPSFVKPRMVSPWWSPPRGGR